MPCWLSTTYALDRYVATCVLWAHVMERHGVARTAREMVRQSVPITIALTALQLVEDDVITITAAQRARK